MRHYGGTQTTAESTLSTLNDTQATADIKHFISLCTRAGSSHFGALSKTKTLPPTLAPLVQSNTLLPTCDYKIVI